ncbi:hypothetical protein [Thioclava sp. L04-15]|uniref:hypothetical protein n=1 Tax=Thioclava sp. L04-15 TaxID=1915318 RepID=UPI0011BABF21|nr:hypothetical protein [Thioclava sp. L04-15]
MTEIRYKLVHTENRSHPLKENWAEFENKKVHYVEGVFTSYRSLAPTLPSEPGAYILYENRKIYCGETATLNRRVVEGIRRMGRDTQCVCFSTSMLKNENDVHSKRFFKEIQDQCIPILATAIHFLRLPIDLENKQGVCLLSPEAREQEKNSVHILAERIAITALYHMGFPKWAYLPYLDMNFRHLSNIPALPLSDSSWDSIRQDELVARRKESWAPIHGDKAMAGSECKIEGPPLPVVWRVSA